MSALGQKQTSEHDWTMSALPPKADMVQQDGDVRFVPKADISREIALAFSVGAGPVLGANETQVANDFIARPWSDAVNHRHVGKIKRAHQRRAVFKPSVNFTRKRTVPQ